MRNRWWCTNFKKKKKALALMFRSMTDWRHEDFIQAKRDTAKAYEENNIALQYVTALLHQNKKEV